MWLAQAFLLFPLALWEPFRDLVPFVQFKKRERHPWTVLDRKSVRSFSHAPFRKYTCGMSHSWNIAWRVSPLAHD